MSIALNKTDAISLLNDKVDLIQTYTLDEPISEDLKKVSEFHYLVRDYFNFLDAVFLAPLCKYLNTGKNTKLKTPALVWIQEFLEKTDPKKNSLFQGIKPFIFVQNGKNEIQIKGESKLSNAVFEAKRRAKELNTVVTHNLKLSALNDLNYTKENIVPPEMDTEHLYFDTSTGRIFYQNKKIHTFIKGSFPQMLFNLALTEYQRKVPLSALVEKEFKYEYTNQAFRNLKRTLANKIKAMKPKPSKTITDSFLIRKPDNTIELSEIFMKQ